MPQLRSNPIDFQVEEIPQYQPSGHGRYTWVWIEKCNLHTDAVVQDLARLLQVPARLIAYAGKKDKRSFSRQYVSLPGDLRGQLPEGRQGNDSYWRIVHAALHEYPLKLGQVIGNAFRLHLDDCNEEAQKQMLELAQQPLLNVFGPQRFGRDSKNVDAACAWAEQRFQDCVDILIDDVQAQQGLMRPLAKQLQRGVGAEQALARSGKRLRQFMASVLQSAVFNAVAKGRAEAGLSQRIRVGDLLLRSGKSAFHARADELDQLQEDLDQGIVSCTAPLPGFKVRTPGAEIEAEEREWAASSGISWDFFSKGSPFASPGERRRVLLQFKHSPEFDGDHMCFSLPGGAYATSVLDALGITHHL